MTVQEYCHLLSFGKCKHFFLHLSYEKKKNEKHRTNRNVILLKYKEAHFKSAYISHLSKSYTDTALGAGIFLSFY